MNKLTSQDEVKLISFIKDWLKVHGYSQKDLSIELNINSSRMSEILNKLKETYKKGGLFNIAKTLIQVEQKWISNNQTSKIESKDSKSYSQLDIDLKVNINSLMDQMNKDHNLKKI